MLTAAPVLIPQLETNSYPRGVEKEAMIQNVVSTSMTSEKCDLYYFNYGCLMDIVCVHAQEFQNLSHLKSFRRQRLNMYYLPIGKCTVDIQHGQASSELCWLK